MITTYEKTGELIYSMEQLERLATRSGSHFFDESARRFFGSRIGAELFGGRYFITSEKCDMPYSTPEPRRYTVRTFSITDTGYISIDTVGEFQQYHSRAAAIAGIAKLLKAAA